mgnify:CR=1 FL=1
MDTYKHDTVDRDDAVLLSSRETSTILMIEDIYDTPQITYMIGEEEVSGKEQDMRNCCLKKMRVREHFPIRRAAFCHICTR